MKRTLYFLAILMFTLSGCSQSVVVPVDAYWKTAPPEDQGMNVELLDSVVQTVDEMNGFHALLVVRNNRIISESYFEDHHVNSLHHVRSITKTFTSSLAGVAVEEGEIESIDVSLSDFYPELDSAKGQITLRQLLNMTAGLEWDEDAEIIGVVTNNVPEPVQTMLARDLVTTPGDSFNYNSLATHIASDVIEQAVAQSIEDYAVEKIFQPVGFGEFAWEKDPEGQTWGGFGLQLSARDIAKYGQLFLNGGSWNGNQVIPEPWVDSVFVQQIELSGTSGYTHAWWHTTSLESHVVFGLGYGGQVLALIPDKDLVIVGLQYYLVSSAQAGDQWRRFVDGVLKPVLRAAE